MTEKQISSTAIFTNMLRADHQMTGSEPKILVDPVSVVFAKQFEGSAALAAFNSLSHSFINVAQSTLVLRNYADRNDGLAAVHAEQLMRATV